MQGKMGGLASILSRGNFATQFVKEIQQKHDMSLRLRLRLLTGRQNDSETFPVRRQIDV
jgi:hypothetical protein